MKIVFISDFDLRGSGYLNISANLCIGLALAGHEVKVIGLQYGGDEHAFPFSLIPATNLQEVNVVYHNLHYMFQPQVVIVALDIPFQSMLLTQFQKYPIPYIVITPLESGPLCLPWAMTLMQAKAVMMISQHATDEANKMGVPAEHLQVGIDAQSWRVPTPEEKQHIRPIIGLEQDEFVILTVADNQERKFLSRSLEIVAEFGRRVTDKFRYVLVTREHHPVGMEIRDYARVLGINQKIVIFERGMGFRELWSIYAAADCFLLTSKAEGLGLPFLEAMAVGVPAVGTRIGALPEHVERGWGLLIEPDYYYTDQFGNGRRGFAGVESGVKCLERVYKGVDVESGVQKARAYAESRTWEKAVAHLEMVIGRVVDEQKE